MRKTRKKWREVGKGGGRKRRYTKRKSRCEREKMKRKGSRKEIAKIDIEVKQIDRKKKRRRKRKSRREEEKKWGQKEKKDKKKKRLKRENEEKDETKKTRKISFS